MKLAKSTLITSKEVARILEADGQNIEPLSTREIEIKLYGKSDRHSNIYRKVHDLAAIKSKDDNIFLTSWNELSAKKNEEYFKDGLVKKISQLFNDPKLENNDSYNFAAYEHERNYGLDISSSKLMPKNKLMQKNIIRISFDIAIIKNIKGFLQTDNAIVGYPLHIQYEEKDKDYKLYVKQSTIGIQRNKIRFLKHVLKDNVKEKISRLGNKDRLFYMDRPNPDASKVMISRNIFGVGKNGWNKSNEILEIQSNPKNFRFYLSLRGFLLYLTRIQSQNSKDIEIKDDPSGKESTKRQGYSLTNKRINKIIEAVTRNTCAMYDFPFLSDYQIFDAIYGSKFKVDILKEIAIELQNQLYTQDDGFLKYWVTRRFHEEMIYSRARGFPFRIYHPLRVMLWKDRVNDNLGKNFTVDEVIEKLRKYDRNMLKLVRNYQKSDLDLIDQLIKNSN